ncbi:MAG: polysulfide reductase NrfD [Actinomycetia bacterium]|nr:polysulfide reductase NrfD [Actinomycetes bacterium]
MVADTKVKKSLPQGIGRFTRGWILFFSVTTIILIIGILAFIYESQMGMTVTGMRDIGTQGGATWGLYVVMVEYFIGVSLAGLVLVAFANVFDVMSLRPISRLATLLTAVSLTVGLLAVVIDLGSPIRGIINMFLYVRPQSAFFGTFTLVAAGVLLTSLVFLFLNGRRDAMLLVEMDPSRQWFYRFWASGYRDTDAEWERHRRVIFWLSILVGPLVVIALSTEGLVFGIQVGRPGWFGALQGPDFIVLAAASGLANLIVLSAIVRKVLDTGTSLIGPIVFKWLGGLLLAASAAVLYFQIVELFTLLYATPGAERQLADALIRGPYAWIFWLGLVLLVFGLVVLVVQAARGTWGVTPLVIAAVAISTSAVAERYLTVIPSQTHGMMLPYEPGYYFPTWVEFAVVAGLFAFGALVIGIFMKVFPIIPLKRRPKQEVLADA